MLLVNTKYSLKHLPPNLWSDHRGRSVSQMLWNEAPQSPCDSPRGERNKLLSCKCICMCAKSGLSAILWTVALQAPLSMGFSRQEYWSGLPCPPPGDLPDPGMEPVSLMSPALTGRFFTPSATWEALYNVYSCYLLLDVLL